MVLKNRSNEIRSNEIRIRRELPVVFLRQNPSPSSTLNYRGLDLEVSRISRLVEPEHHN